MRCPACGLVNPDSALKCKCGYDFMLNAKIERRELYGTAGIKNYFKESWQLTWSNSGGFAGGTLLLYGWSVITLGMMFPCLMTGLEGMYIRARQGKKISAIDVFMHIRKFFPLAGASFLIFLRVTLTFFLFGIPMGIILLALSFLAFEGFADVNIPFLGSIVIGLGLIVIISYREGRYLHTLNFIAEHNFGVLDSFRQSKLVTKNREGITILAFLYVFISGLLFSPNQILPQMNPHEPHDLPHYLNLMSQNYLNHSDSDNQYRCHNHLAH